MSISRRQFLKKTAAAALAGAAAPLWLGSKSDADGQKASASFEPTWESLSSYQCPEWFRDAKFGMWAHWSAQCVPEQGDWYARLMYMPPGGDYQYQCEHYGHPSKVGFKDIDHIWHAENWDPEYLIDLYKAAGAKYFMALGNHHDNFDTWNSKYQPWNSVAIGPKKDIIGTWARAVRRHGLKFAVSVHASHTWNWFEVAQGADKTGPFAGVPYDGKLTKADGKGLWWEGLDPQDLYAQNHAPGKGGLVWDFDPAKGSSVPDQAYIDKFYNRVIDLIDQHHPDMLYFDDTVLPLYPTCDAGLKIAAYYYNNSMSRNHGRVEVAITGKGLSDQQRMCLVEDFERGQSDKIQPLPWQTDTCIGNWHYQRSLYENHQYKSVAQVVHMLVDIVSKNGNLMLNIPVRGDGTIDPDELKFVKDMAAWTSVNGDAIFATRPWAIYGEGATRAGGGLFSERRLNYTAQDIRFTTKGNRLFAFAMAWPDNCAVTIKTLAAGAPGIVGNVRGVRLLGSDGNLPFVRNQDGLTAVLPRQKPCDHAYSLEISGLDLAASKPSASSA
jgi:alpha-L-fucosidase